MSRAALLLALPMILACAREEEAPMTDTAAATAEAPAANYAGNWTINTMPEGRDTVVVTYDIVATNDQTGWSIVLPGRQAMEPRIVSISGDSVVTELGPFESVLRPNVMVTTHTTMRLEGDQLVGTTIARYNTTGPDSVVTLRVVGTRR